MHTTFTWQDTLPENLPFLSFQAAKDLVGTQSLTAALRKLPETFSVELLYLGEAESGEMLADCCADTQGFVRDVYLKLDNVPVVWARSFCRADDTVWREILNCGTRPLGERLFNGSLALQRTPFAYATLPEKNCSGSLNIDLLRRSLFDLNGQTLALVEGFLPSLWAMLK